MTISKPVKCEIEIYTNGNHQPINSQGNHKVAHRSSLCFHNTTNDNLLIAVQEGLIKNVRCIPVPAHGFSNTYNVRGSAKGNFNYKFTYPHHDDGSNTGQASGSIHVEPDSPNSIVQ